jgi:hypothetical protein
MWKSVLVNKLRGLIMKLTKRGKRVRAVLVLIGLWAIWQISGHVWWVEDHYCWGEMVECYFPD